MTAQTTVQRPTLMAAVAQAVPGVAAIAANVCLAMHALLLAIGGRNLLPLSVPMVTLSAFCAICATRARRVVAPGAMWSIVAFAGAMVAMHLLMMHAHVGIPGRDATMSGSLHTDLLMHAGVTLAGAQALLAVTGIVCITRSGIKFVEVG